MAQGNEAAKHYQKLPEKQIQLVFDRSLFIQFISVKTGQKFVASTFVGLHELNQAQILGWCI